MLSSQPDKTEWAPVEWLVLEYLNIRERPPVLDLSGGQPELTPELILLTMQALIESGRAQTVYLWSDDNLSNDYFWRYLSASERAYIAAYDNYGKVGCFKGFDEQSFAFNTEADHTLFAEQFKLFERYIDEGIDIYAYVTITHPKENDIRDDMKRFIDRLQTVDLMLPLRTIPLEISGFGPVTSRLDPIRHRAMTVGQYDALDEWQREIEARFSREQREIPIHKIKWNRT
jgi:hypothetical protein